MHPKEILQNIDSLNINGTSVKIIRLVIKSINKARDDKKMILENSSSSFIELGEIVTLTDEVYDRLIFLSQVAKVEYLGNQKKISRADLVLYLGYLTLAWRCVLEPVVDEILEEKNLMKSSYNQLVYNNFNIEEP